MKKNLEEMQVKVANKRAILESHDGEEFSPITIAKNVLTDDRQNLQDILSDRKEDMMTPTIENSSSMFKVGQGDNVDYSENVVDGAYESMVLKGRSLVNLVTKNGVIQAGSSANVPIQDTGYSHKVALTSQGSKVLCYNLKQTLKSNVDYFVYIPSKLSSNIQCTVGFYDGNIYNQHGVSLEGRNYAILRACSSDIQLTIGHHGTGFNSGDTLEVFYPILVEYQEGMENWNWNYFEGICDVKSPILTNIGKNIIPQEYQKWYPCFFKKGTEFVLSTKDEVPSKGGNIVFKDGNDEKIWLAIDEGKTKSKKVLPNDVYYISNQLVQGIEHQLELGKEATTYEPYKFNTTTFSTDDDKTIVLRSLPNGVCDTLNVKTGEYVQNIGEVVLDGSEDERWAYNIAGSGQGKKCFNLPSELTPHRKRFGYIICDCMPTTNTLDKIGVYNGEGLNILIDSDSNDVGVLKEILTNKPITVQYQLATPIVKQINVEGYPYAYENGHVLLESGSQEQSLTPTIEYSIVANRGGQIRSNQRMVERHQKKLDSLYAMTLVNMIDSQYRQVLMKLKSELGSEVTSWDI